MEADIKKYENQNKTGNKVSGYRSDYQEPLLRKNNITFTRCRWNLAGFYGRYGYLQYFGNALDNAIECELKIPDKEKG